MSGINITSVDVLDNPTKFTNPLIFEIQYECLQRLEGDLEFKLIYVGSADDETKDQVLDEVLLGPVDTGNYRFVFQADAPDSSLIPSKDIVGVTVVLLTCSYQNQELIRVGYYVANEYVEDELRENPPEQPIIDKLYRNILADKPRVTRFPVEFDIQANALDINDGDQGMEGAHMAAAPSGVDAYQADAYHNENMPTHGAGMVVDDNHVPAVTQATGKLALESEGGFGAAQQQPADAMAE